MALVLLEVTLKNIREWAVSMSEKESRYFEGRWYRYKKDRDKAKKESARKDRRIKRKIKKVRQKVTDRKSFGEAFKKKRKEKGSDSTFTWREKEYTTKHKDEVKKKRYGGSVSYSSGSVGGYSKSYPGMGGDDE